MSTNDDFFDEQDDELPEIMDEHQWEALMQESDRRTDKYMELLEKYRDDPNAEQKIDEEMGWKKLDGEEDESTNFDVESIWAEMEEFEASERWKELTGYEDPGEMYQFEDLPVYQKHYSYSLDTSKIVDQQLNETDDPSVQKFCNTLFIPAVKIAGGFGFGFEVEGLGGNIANCKRGLVAANQMLEALYDIGQKGLLDRETYLDLQQRGKEARDDLALYIIELRRRFYELRGL